MSRHLVLQKLCQLSQSLISPSRNFGSFWHDIYQVKLNAAATKGGGAAAYNLEYDSTGGSPCEGSFMFYYSGYYYLTWSRGVCCGYDTYVLFPNHKLHILTYDPRTKPAAGAEYKIMMCRSTSAPALSSTRQAQHAPRTEDPSCLNLMEIFMGRVDRVFSRIRRRVLCFITIMRIPRLVLVMGLISLDGMFSSGLVDGLLFRGRVMCCFYWLLEYTLGHGLRSGHVYIY